jgi:GT2 family glycosyltransferase
LNWNQPGDTLKCLGCVAAQTFAKYSTIVVDNGSSDDSVARFRALPQSVRTVALERNLGFSEGMNAGIRLAFEESHEFVWLLNNDAFAEPTCLERLVSALTQDPGLVMVGPKLFWGDGREQEPGAMADWRSGAFENLSAAELVSRTGHDFWLMGAAPLVRVSALRNVGLFEPAFFAYMEDADLGVRLSYVGNIRVVPEAVVVHTGGATSGGYASAFCQYLMTRNRWLFLSRNAPPGSRWARWLRFTAGSLRIAQIYEAKGLEPARLGVLAGVTAARRGEFGPPGRLDDCGWFERLASTHPTRFGNWLDTIARWLETAWGLTHQSPATGTRQTRRNVVG